MIETVDIARTRQGLYRFLGGAMLAPSGAQFDLLAEAVGVLDDRDIDMFTFSRDWRRLARHFPVEIVDDGLDVEYVRLFASGMSGALSPPTESYYRVPAKGGGIAEFVADLQREYLAMGIASVGLEEAPDHISTELDVMAYLCDIEANASAEGQTGLAEDALAREGRFLDQHLAAWIPAFRTRVHDADPVPFYRDLVDAVHAFIVHDRDYVHLIRDGMVQ